MERNIMDTHLKISKSETKTALQKRRTGRIPVWKPVATSLKIQSATNSPVRLSKILAREPSSISSRSAIPKPLADKRFLLRKKIKTDIDLNSAASALTRATHTPPSSLRFPSTSTVNSTFHKPGEIPSYLKKPKKCLIEAEINAKKKVFNVQKKKLNDLQSDFLMTHQNLQEMLIKHNPTAERTDSIGDVKLVAIVENDDGNLLIRDELKKILQTEEKKISHDENVTSSTLDLDQIRSKLTTVNQAGFKLCHEFLENLNKIQFENEVGDGNTIQDQLVSIIKGMNEKVFNEESEQAKHLTEVLFEMQTAPLNQAANVSGPDRFSESNETTKQISSLMEELQDYKSKLEASELKLKLLSDQETKKIQSLKNQLHAKESLLDEKDMEISKVQKALKKVEASLQKEKIKTTAILKELETKESIVQKLKKDNENLKLELSEIKRENNNLNETNCCLRDNVARLESVTEQKVAIISELESKIVNGLHLVNESKELKKEMKILRDSENNRQREINTLQSELAKARMEIKEQAELISTNQRLLRIRNELINSLQGNNETEGYSLADLYPEITKKRTEIN